MLIGAHVPSTDPRAEASARDADCVQFFLSAPQTWKRPQPREDAEALRAGDLPIYVHAPYLINVASPNNRVRMPSRKSLQQTCDAAAAIGAAGVIVHGGHVDAESSLTTGFDNWRKALQQLESNVPVLIENTAGGKRAMARYVETIARLWEVIGQFEAGGQPVGFCFDTCHAHAAGEDPTDVIERVRAATGRIDLVHVNDSKDKPGCGRDRHTNLGAGEIDPDALVAMVQQAGAPALVETPGDANAQAEDIAWLRERVLPGRPVTSAP